MCICLHSFHRTRGSYITSLTCEPGAEDFASCQMTVGDCSEHQYAAAVTCTNSVMADSKQYYVTLGAVTIRKEHFTFACGSSC